MKVNVWISSELKMRGAGGRLGRISVMPANESRSHRSLVLIITAVCKRRRSHLWDVVTLAVR
jgi:hypothetical protein